MGPQTQRTRVGRAQNEDPGEEADRDGQLRRQPAHQRRCNRGRPHQPNLRRQAARIRQVARRQRRGHLRDDHLDNC